MNYNVIVTCAVTGAGDTTGKSPHVPVTPKDIAAAAIEAAKAGAAIVHIHACDPETGKGSRDPKLFKEVADRVRDSATDVVINLTAGWAAIGSPLKKTRNARSRHGYDHSRRTSCPCA